MEETGTIEFVRNAVIASVCGHSKGIGGKPCFRLLSGRPWVRIPPGVPTGQPSPYGRVFLLAIFCRFGHTAVGRGQTMRMSPQWGVQKANELSSLARNEHRHRSKVPVQRLSERNRIPPGVRKIRQEKQNVENLADFSFSHSNFIFLRLANF